MREMKRCKREWSDLPQQALSQICYHSKINGDLRKFRAVCKNWRSSSSSLGQLLDTHLPTKIPLHSSIFKRSHLPVLLVRTAVYILQPLDPTVAPKSWLVSVEELTPGKLRFHFPLTNTPVKDLPINFPETLNLLDFRVFRINRGLKFRFANGCENVFNIDGFSHCPMKVVLLQSTGMVIALSSGGNLVSFGLFSGQTRRIGYVHGVFFDDIVAFKGQVCAVDRKGRAYLIDGTQTTAKNVISGPIFTRTYTPNDKPKALVESFGELYLINRWCWHCFSVYKLNQKEKVWDKLDGLGDRILFASFDYSFFVDAQQLPGFRGNCILFPKDRFLSYCSSTTSSIEDGIFEGASEYLKIGVYYFDENRMEPSPSLPNFLYRDGRRCMLISYYKGLSDFFWPPPSWVLPETLSCASVSNEADELQSDNSSPIHPLASDPSSTSVTYSLAAEEFQTVQKDGAPEVLYNNDISGRSSWSNLSQELLLAIVERLETQYDIIRFRAVCKAWRQSTSFSFVPQTNLLSPTFPHKLSTPTACFLGELSLLIPAGKSLSIVACSVFLLQSALNPQQPPWLFTVEELNPGKVYLRKPLSRVAIKNLPEYFPKMLQLSNFQLSNIGRFHTLRFTGNSRDVIGEYWGISIHKVVLVVNSDCKTTPTVDDYSVIVLYDDGNLSALRLENEEHKHFGSITGTRKFDDIVNFKGRIYAVDRKGRAHRMHSKYFLLESIGTDPIGKGCGGEKKKRLAELCGELYLVYKSKDCFFKVYKLNEEQEKWIEVQGVGDDRILFVTFDGCFFASAKYLPGWRGNCIVYYRGCFPSYSAPHTHTELDVFKTFGKTELEIAIFHFESGDCGPIASYPGYSNVLWPPPAWLSSENDSLVCIPQIRDEVQVSPKPISETEITPVSLPVAHVMPTVCEEGPSRNGNDSASTTDFQHQLHESCNAMQRNQATDVESLSDTSSCAMGKFQGVAVSSHLIPILQKIWDKHGNIMQGHALRSDILLTWALESLAEMIVILHSDSGKSLNESQASFLSSTLHDLQLMHFRLDWLAPFVEKAVALRQNKEQLGAIMELEATKSKLVVELHEVKKRLHEVDTRLAEQRKFIPEILLISPALDVKELLG